MTPGFRAYQKGDPKVAFWSAINVAAGRAPDRGKQVPIVT